MKPAAFEYHRPSTIDDAVGLLGELGDDAKVIAGGQSLIPMLNLRLTSFGHLVDIGRIASLRGIRQGGDDIEIGAGTTQAEIERSGVVSNAVPLLSSATRLIGHFQIRSRGTIGGSLAHADPSAEYPAVAAALDARLDIVGPRGRRSVAATEFFTGQWTTLLADDEILTSVSFPVWSGRRGFAIREFARRHGDFALAGSAVAVELDDDDRVRRCAIALFGLGPVPVRATYVEATVAGGTLAGLDATAIGWSAVAPLDHVSADLHGSADYRRRVGAAMTSRAWTAAIEEARR